MAMSQEQFVAQLTASGLIPAVELQSIVQALLPEQQWDGTQLAGELVRLGKLSAFQAQQICLGKGKNLVLGNYVVLDKLGQGGMGVVLKAEHRRMKRLVAIKVLSPAVTESPEALRRFQREVEADARLTHPNIVTAYDADEASGTHFLVMEYVEGINLSKLIKAKGPLPVEKALVSILQVSRGLQYAHQHGVVHRDIKPSNLLLDHEGNVKILDMGLARLESSSPKDDELTGSGQIMGTVDYMAPEQALHIKSADARADIYSLGITLWYLLTGRAAYPGESAMAKLLAHREQPIPSLCRACPAASPALEAVFTKMVAKRPNDRYQRMADVITDLERCLAHMGLAVDASTPSLAGLPGEASRWQDLLRGAALTLQPAMATKEIPEQDATSPAIEATMAFQSPQVDTDPKTELLLGSPLVGRANAHRKSGKLGQTNRTSLIALSGAMLLFLGAAVFYFTRVRSGVHEHGQPSLTETWHDWPSDAPQPAIAPFPDELAKSYQEKWAAYLDVPVEYKNSLGMTFRLIPPGEFMMGSSSQEIEKSLQEVQDDDRWRACMRSEAPRHKVILTQPWYVGIHEVTQSQYESVMGTNPSHFSPQGAGKDDVTTIDTAHHPVETVSWNDAAEFCAKLSLMEGLKPCYFRTGEAVTPLDGTGYRLPSEAEWEFTCRAGTISRFWSGDKDEDLIPAGWFGVNSQQRTHAVGELKANPFGVFDVHGNVWEWVQDWWEPDYFGQTAEEPSVDPAGPSSGGTQHVVRGGYWRYSASGCRSSVRYADIPWSRLDLFGLRVVLDVGAVRIVSRAP